MIPWGPAIHHPGLYTDALKKRQDDEIGRAVAGRILSLQLAEEKDADFARRIGVSPQDVWNWKNGKGGAQLKTVVAVHRNVEVSLNWLITGASHTDAYAAGLEAGQRVLEKAAGEIKRLLEPARALGEAAAKGGRASKAAARARRPPAAGAQGGRSP